MHAAPSAARGEGGRAERGVGVRTGERSARAGRSRRPNKVCFDEKRLRLLFRVGRRVLLAPGFGRVMVLGSVRKARRTKAGGQQRNKMSASGRGPAGPGGRAQFGRAGRVGGSGARSPQVHRWEDVRYPFVTRGNLRWSRWVPAPR